MDSNTFGKHLTFIMGLGEIIWGKTFVMTVGSFQVFMEIVTLTCVLHVKVNIFLRTQICFVAPVDPTKIPKDPDDQWTFCMNTPGCIEACVRARLGLLCSGLCSIAREVTHAHTRARARAAHVELRERGREWPRVQHWKFRHHRLDKRREGTGRLWPPRYHGAGCICGM